MHHGEGGRVKKEGGGGACYQLRNIRGTQQGDYY